MVDDSPIVIATLKKILSKSDSIEIVGTAGNGKEGMEKIATLNPDMICTDLMMPIMDGLEFTKQIMENSPKPILVISSAVQKEDTGNIFNLLQAGAVDVYPKPRGNQTGDYDKIADELIKKIKVVNGVVVFSRKKTTSSFQALPTTPGVDTTSHSFPAAGTSHNFKIVLIGASTGGPPALLEILSRLPATFPIPIVCVQHISIGFSNELVKWLNNNVSLKVKTAKQGEMPSAGNIYFPTEDCHLGIDPGGKFMDLKSVPFKGHRPSVSVSFYSFFEYYRANTLAVLLTGMGDDGADAMKAIRTQGGYTIAQDEKTCVVFGMPKVAIELGGAKEILPLPNIAGRIKELCKVF